jgi:hypothetical protein
MASIGKVHLLDLQTSNLFQFTDQPVAILPFPGKLEQDESHPAADILRHLVKTEPAPDYMGMFCQDILRTVGFLDPVRDQDSYYPQVFHNVGELYEPEN